MRVHRRSTSSAGEAWVPPPPSATPAAGGWGKPASRRVYMVGFVGFGRCSVGEALEVLELLVRVLLSAWIPSGGGVLWSFAVPRATCWSPEIGGFLRLRSPRPDPAAADLGELETEVVHQIFVAVQAAPAVVSSEAVLKTSRLPRGGLRRSKIWGAWAAARQRQLRLRLRRRDPAVFVVIFLCSGSL